MGRGAREETMKKPPSLEQLRNKNGSDLTRISNLYKGWDKSARNKNFEECERIERRIRDIHDRNGIQET